MASLTIYASSPKQNITPKMVLTKDNGACNVFKIPQAATTTDNDKKIKIIFACMSNSF